MIYLTSLVLNFIKINKALELAIITRQLDEDRIFHLKEYGSTQMPLLNPTMTDQNLCNLHVLSQTLQQLCSFSTKIIYLLFSFMCVFVDIFYVLFGPIYFLSKQQSSLSHEPFILAPMIIPNRKNIIRFSSHFLLPICFLLLPYIDWLILETTLVFLHCTFKTWPLLPFHFLCFYLINFT